MNLVPKTDTPALQEATSDARRLTEAYKELQQAQQLVEGLYARWAELEAKVAT